MSYSAYAVIGANYGDEGKGLVTDYYCRKLKEQGEDPVVVRFNGGSQAGHTVVTPEGSRHVFGSLGSGSFVGAPTHFSSHTIVNPTMFNKEFDKFREVSGLMPRVSVDPEAIVTTPIDMLVNQIAESIRGINRHGSCGMGINETVVRNASGILSLKAIDLFEGFQIRNFVRVQAEFGIRRLKEMGFTLQQYHMDKLFDHKWMGVFEDAVRIYRSRVQMIEDTDILSLGTPVFEGAQGLGLHETKGHFPYVTRSRTGLENVGMLCDMLGIVNLYPTYVSRVYNSRHGEGPMDWDNDPGAMNLAEVRDTTNMPGEWQGTLRTQALNISSTIERIDRDLSDLASANVVTAYPRFVLTHCDTVGDMHQIRYKVGPQPMQGTIDELSDYIRNRLGLTLGDFKSSWGPTAEDIR